MPCVFALRPSSVYSGSGVETGSGADIPPPTLEHATDATTASRTNTWAVSNARTAARTGSYATA